ncbi:hypothetical protein PR202_gb04847 [Eleusine coracana subsp. coracana]|uniref:Uncharacterized protein n=1 Tax=Eleusine coracana subsp. coracana TaxID=191504 RepID=A0AAV5E5D9_ELECO|nr:hypothetical protein PR202_gb04847 [Eleusine coracana subsp. coracana]
MGTIGGSASPSGDWCVRDPMGGTQHWSLEGITTGIPMLCRPLGMGVYDRGYGCWDGDEGVQSYRTGLIKAEEVETKVRFVMESDEGKELKTRVTALKVEAEEALQLGGSSHSAFTRFLLDVEKIREQFGE